MSLEEAIKENTAAVKALTEYMRGKIEPTTSVNKTPSAKESAPKPATAAPAPSPVGKSAPSASAADTATRPIEYADVKKLTLELVKKNRDVAIEVLKEFGAENALKLKPEQYPAYMKKVEAKLEELVKL